MTTPNLVDIKLVEGYRVYTYSSQVQINTNIIVKTASPDKQEGQVLELVKCHLTLLNTDLMTFNHHFPTATAFVLPQTFQSYHATGGVATDRQPSEMRCPLPKGRWTHYLSPHILVSLRAFSQSSSSSSNLAPLAPIPSRSGQSTVDQHTTATTMAQLSPASRESLSHSSLRPSSPSSTKKPRLFIHPSIQKQPAQQRSHEPPPKKSPCKTPAIHPLTSPPPTP